VEVCLLSFFTSTLEEYAGQLQVLTALSRGKYYGTDIMERLFGPRADLKELEKRKLYCPYR
jgi:hypothetical protein